MSEVPPAGSPEPTPPTPANTPGTPPPSAPLPPDSGDPADVEKNKIMAILSYLGILVLIPILAAKDSPFAKYHANQGLLLTIGAFVIFFGLGIVFAIVSFIKILGLIASCFSCFLFPVLSLAYLAFVVLGILNCVNGKMKPLPLFPVITIIK